MDLKQLAKTLSRDPDYRVVERYKRPTGYSSAENAQKTEQRFRGLIVDVETTGLDPEQEAIIELALLAFEYSKEGKVYHILEEYSGFEAPDKPIPPGITQLTGITDDMVAGKCLDNARVTELVEQSHLIIAHNAKFDRRFLERRFPVFAEKPWACSAHQIDWKALGIESAKLSYIAYRYGFFYEGHRALNDCEACLHILALPCMESEKTGLGFLLENARQNTVRLFAVNAPFAQKDVLRARGYAWNDGGNGRPRAWYKDVSEEEEEQEHAYLEEVIFGRAVHLETVKVDPWNRFSDRV